jgi:3-mercaptopyruvate sulfurtransferase SseA
MKSGVLLRIVLLLAAISLLASCGGAGVAATPTGTPEAPLISVDDLRAELDAGSNIAIVDSRSESYYEESHIPGAISVPLRDMLDKDLNPLPPEEIDLLFGYLKSYDEIVTYCT